jgi:hypothetical protein
MLEQGAKVCPFCGADQSRPVQIVDPHLPLPVTAKSLYQAWKLVIVVIVVFAGSMGGMLWHNFGEASISPAAQAARVTSKSLRELREALSAYVISRKETYPATLNPLGERVSLPLQAAMTAGYKLEYSPKTSPNEAGSLGFVIIARPEKSGFLNLRIDESGVVRATEDSRPATARDLPY